MKSSMKKSKASFRSHFNNYWPIFAIGLLVFVFFWKFFIKGLIPLPADLLTGTYLPWTDYFANTVHNPIVSDAVSFIYPERILGINMLKSGVWPLWNPYILGGAPLLANFQSAPFSPTNIFYFLFEDTNAWSLQVIIQHFLAGAFMYLLLRYWKISKKGSMLGSLAFAFSGFLMIWSQWSVHSLVTALIPLLIFLEDNWLRSGKYKYLILFSLALAIELFSGYPQIVFYTLIALGLLWLFRLREMKNKLFQTILLGLAGLLGLGMAAMQILPAMELVEHSQRIAEPIPLEWVFIYPKEIIAFLVPDYFGNHVTGDYWGPKNYLGTVGFIGIIPAILAIIGVFNVKKREVVYCISLVTFSLALAFKTPVSLYLWKINFLGLSAAVFYKSLAVFVVAISALVGFGYDAIGKLNLKKIIIRISPIYIFLILYVIATFNLLVTTSNDLSRSTLRGIPKYEVAVLNMIVPLLILFSFTLLVVITKNIKRLSKFIFPGIFMLMVIEMFYFGWKFTPFSKKEYIFPSTPVFEYLKEQKEKEPFRVSGGDVLELNLNIPYELEFVGGYDAVYPYLAAKYLGVANSNDADAKHQDRFGHLSNYDSRLANLMNMKYLLMKKGSEFDRDKYELVFNDKSVNVLKNKQYLQRAFVVYDWEVLEDDEKTLEMLLDENYDLQSGVILNSDPNLKKSTVGEYRIDYLKISPQKNVYEVETNQDGLLFVSDIFFPGWKAYVNEEVQDILRADFAFRAVPVSAGKSIVEMEYEPESFKRGLKISAISFFLLVVIGVGARIRKRKK